MKETLHVNQPDADRKGPRVKTILVDESGLGTQTPEWFKEEGSIPDVRLREIVLVGATPADLPPNL